VRFLICLLTRLKCEVVMSTCHAGEKCTRSFDAPKTEPFSFYSKYVNGTYKRALIREVKLYHHTDDQHPYFHLAMTWRKREISRDQISSC
jgi:hypothetical protein